MKLKRVLTHVAGGIGGLVAIGALFVQLKSSSMINQEYSIPSQKIAIPSDSASIARGKHLAIAIAKCVDCHGWDFAGKTFLSAPPATITGSNLTSGTGGIGKLLTDEDWIRAIRHGVNRTNKAILLMPADDYRYLSDEDVANIVAFMKSLPPINNTPTPSNITFLGKALLAFGQFPVFSAARFEHSTSFARSSNDKKQDLGKYIAQTGGCYGCHGEKLTGGKIPGAPPEFPAAPNITQSGEIQKWSYQDFKNFFATGVRPNGSAVHEIMPWKAASHMTEEEFQSLWNYLHNL